MNTVGYFSVGPPIDYSKQGYIVTTSHSFRVKSSKPYNVMKFTEWLEEDRYAPEATIDIAVDDFQPKKSLMERYGQKVINTKFYGVVSFTSDGVSNLGSKKSND